jgi:catechol 2,3-dioxygenase-like lactoylglutathione lyase family enzyme
MTSSHHPFPALGTHHTSLEVRDLEASLSFYRDLLGMREVSRGGKEDRIVVLLDIGDGTHLELTHLATPSPTRAEAPWRHLALSVNEIHRAVEILRAAGRPIPVEPREIRLGSIPATIAFFEGPDGESVELFQVHAQAS